MEDFFPVRVSKTKEEVSGTRQTAILEPPLSRSLRNPISADEPSRSSEIEKLRRLICLREPGPLLTYGSSGWDWAPTVTVMFKR
jgi:hypothetical protein